MTIYQLIFGFGPAAPSIAMYIAGMIYASWLAMGLALPWLLAVIVAEMMFL